MRIRLAFPLALLALAAGASVHAEDTDGQAPAMVQATTVNLVSVSAESASGEFALINQNGGACYAVVPPDSANIAKGGNYALLPASDIDENLRVKFAKDYPNCKIVYVVARTVE